MKERTKSINSSSTRRLLLSDPRQEMSPVFPITPEQFWSVFSEALRSEWSDPKKHVPNYFNNSPAWTKYITGFLKALSGKFSCVSDAECWPRIDMGYYDKVGAEWDEWALEAAIEHENEVNWNAKLSRLLMINAGLKVLIAYSDNQEWVLGMLNRFVEIRRSRKYVPANGGWIFIFGPRYYPSNHDFSAYKCDGQEIVEITGEKRIVS